MPHLTIKTTHRTRVPNKDDEYQTDKKFTKISDEFLLFELVAPLLSILICKV